MKVLVLGPDWRNHEIITALTGLGHDVKLWIIGQNLSRTIDVGDFVILGA